jgi:hypothetical protein
MHKRSILYDFFPLSTKKKFKLFLVFTKNSRNLYNNLAKPICTVCAFSISSQTSGPKVPIFSQGCPKLAVKPG